MRRFVLLAALLCLTGSVAFAQDAVKVDPKHYKVELENSQVRVLRIHYGAHEKSVMHHHPDSVVTFLTDAHVKFTLPDGTSTEHTVKAGEVQWTPAGTHLPENLGDTAMEGILVELKHPAAAAKPAPKPPAK
jgi:quercetin dioxygenase-like cupin family protein